MLNNHQLADQQHQHEPRKTPVASASLLGPADLSFRELSSLDLILVALLVGLILVSIVGNCLVCVAIFTDRRLRKLGNAFIVSLAIADLFVSCLVMTFALCNELLTYWIFGDWFCDLWISFDVMCSTASILNLCAISLDRFVHIKDCLLYNQWMTRRVAISAVIIIWFTSALVSIVPINLGWHRPASSAPGAAGSSLARLHEPGRPGAHHYEPHLIPARLLGEPLEPADRKLNYSPIENQSSLSWANSDNTSRPDFVSQPALNATEPAHSSGPRLARWPQFNQAQSNRPLRHEASLSSHPGPPDTGQRQASLGQAHGRHEDQTAPLPSCVLTLTPTYALVSSTISFYIPCLIMLGLYTKLFACARKHVRNIQAISKVPAPLAPQPAEPSRWRASTSAQLQGSPSLPAGANLERAPFLHNSSSNSKTSPAGLASQQQQQRTISGQLATHKAAVTLGIIMGTFLFCWVPFFCLNVIKAFCVDCIPGSVFRAFTWLGYANSALNPIIYGIHNTEFRNAFNRIFFKHLNFKNSRYYLNRRLSYDLRHSNQNTNTTIRRSQIKSNMPVAVGGALAAASAPALAARPSSGAPS